MGRFTKFVVRLPRILKSSTSIELNLLSEWLYQHIVVPSKQATANTLVLYDVR